MNERLLHRRSKGPVSSPAQRLVELQQEIFFLESQLEQERAKTQELGTKLDRFYRMTDTSFGGIAMAQIWTDMWVWEAVLNQNTQLKSIFELGTWKGGFSWWLWAQAQARNLSFWTYDIQVPEAEVPRFRKADIYIKADEIGECMRHYEPCLVFCDGGNKPRELKTYSQQIRHSESLLIVHDWGQEIGPADVPDNVQMLYGSFCDEIGSISRVFRLGESDA